MSAAHVFLRPNTPRRLKAAATLGAGDYFWHAADFSPDSRLLLPGHALASPWGEPMPCPTLRDWARIAAHMARCYYGLGVRPREPVGVYGRFGAGYFLHFLALSRLGAISVLVNENMPGDIAAAYLQRVGVRVLMHDGAAASHLEGGPIQVVTERDLAAADERNITAYPYAHDDSVMVTHSSGTTGVPKAVTHRHGPYFFAMAQSLRSPRDAAIRCAVSALPASHNSAIGAAAFAVVNGEKLVMMPSQDGAAAVAAIAQHKAGCLVAFPRTFVDILALNPDPAALESLELWINLGDAAHEAHIRRLTRYGTRTIRGRRLPGSRFADGLGSSEMGSMLFVKVHEPGEAGFARCVGTPADWVDAAVLGRDGMPVPDGVSGRLGVRSPGTFSGYWNTPTGEASVLGGYFLTGDIARRDPEGRFFHLDRTSDEIIAGGNAIHTLVIEEAIMLAADAVLDCCVVATETRPGQASVTCLAVLRSGANTSHTGLLSTANAALRAARLPTLDVLEIVGRDEIPVGMTGKTLKYQIRHRMRGTHQTGEQIKATWSGGFAGRGSIQLGDQVLPFGLTREPSNSATPSPMSLLVASASGCYVATLAALLERAGIAVDRIDIDSAAGFAGGAPPRLTSIVHRPRVVTPVPFGSRAHEVQRLFETARRLCPTHRLLHGVDMRIEGTVTARGDDVAEGRG